MDYRDKTLEELSAKAGNISSKQSLVGFDGFIDQIVTPVDQRTGPGNQFTPIKTIKQFSQRIQSASGNSTNIELYPKIEKIGGNGPIMANALLATGQKTRYIGALGDSSPHPAFTEFAKKTNATTLCAPGITQALEFSDGKIMFGSMASFDKISYQHIIDTMGEGSFMDAVSRADLIALVNWTMTPNLTNLLNKLIDKLLVTLAPHEGRTFFFDLTDPSKRSQGDLKAFLATIKRFQSHGAVILGLNFTEAKLVYEALGKTMPERNKKNLKKVAIDICEALEITIVTIHEEKYAVCANRQDTFETDGAYTDSPKITTGGGDNFNAGFATGFILDLSPQACLTLGVAFSGYYVKHAKSPTLTDITSFISSW